MELRTYLTSLLLAATLTSSSTELRAGCITKAATIATIGGIAYMYWPSSPEDIAERATWLQEKADFLHQGAAENNLAPFPSGYCYQWAAKRFEKAADKLARQANTPTKDQQEIIKKWSLRAAECYEKAAEDFAQVAKIAKSDNEPSGIAYFENKATVCKQRAKQLRKPYNWF